MDQHEGSQRPGAGPPSAPEWGRRGLTSTGKRVAYAAVEAFLSEADESGRAVPPPVEVSRKVVRGYELGVGAGSTTVRFGVGMMLQLLEWAPPLVVGRWARLSRLPLNDRIAILAAMEDSGGGLLTTLLVATKIPMLVNAHEDPRSLHRIGFDRPTVAARRALDTLPDREGQA